VNRCFQSLLLIGVLLVGAGSLHAQASSYRLCVQNIDYFPHYDFSSLPGRGYAAEVFALFSATKKIQFQLRPLPVKRLQNNSDCDLIYPDNAQWHSARGNPEVQFFSLPLVSIAGASLVRKGDAQLTLAQIRAIAVPRGFTPDHLLAVQADHHFELVETTDANTALMMLLKKRVDAVDVEWHVARHLLAKTGNSGEVEIGQQLPFASIAFHLSSNRHGELLRQFDRFLQENAPAIQGLQQKYQLQSVNELIHPNPAERSYSTLSD